MRRSGVLFSVLVSSAVLAMGFLATPLGGVAHAATVPDVTYTFAASAQSAAASYWTPGAIANATGVAPAGPRSADAVSPPPGIPDPVYFNGVRTVGALFFTTGTENHFCTASVVDSVTLNLVLTAAHCVDHGQGRYATNVVYVPEYHNGIAPYGAWPVATITVTSAWDSAKNVNDDFAFLKVTPPAGQHLPVQLVTGGLLLGPYTGYQHGDVHVIGYNNTDSQPIVCKTSSFYAMPQQQEFYCNNFNDGTSGGPWILGLNPVTGSGIVIGDIGGFEEGGNYPWASYSSYYDATILRLYGAAQAAQL